LLLLRVAPNVSGSFLYCTTAKLWLCSRRAPKHHISTHTHGLIISLRCAALGDSFWSPLMAV
jgi:hypothetical protein